MLCICMIPIDVLLVVLPVERDVLRYDWSCYMVLRYDNSCPHDSSQRSRVIFFRVRT